MALLAALLPWLVAAGRPAGPPSGRILMTYEDSWREAAATSGSGTRLAATPAYVNLVALSFVRPDLTYRGDLDLSGTGLSYAFDGRVLRDAVAALRRRSPGVRVLLSIGSRADWRWDALDERAVSRLVRDLGVDGVDVDYEPTDPACAPGRDGRVRCASDAPMIAYVRRLRSVLPRPFVVSVTGWSVGAFGERAFAGAGPPSPWTGSSLALLRSPAAADIDLMVVCAYDAGPRFDPLQALDAYRAAWRGPVVVGFEVPFKDALGPFFGPAEVEGMTRRLRARPGVGAMIYSLFEPPDPATPAAEHADGAALAHAACLGLLGGPCPGA